MNNDLDEHAWISESGMLPFRQSDGYADLSTRDPAWHAMTDFTRTVPISVAPERTVDEAIASMVRFGIRALLVVRGTEVTGLLSSYDVEGLAGRTAVADAMIQWSELPTVDWSTMQAAKVADLLEIFHGVGVMHLLVVEGRDVAGGGPVVRGLVSRSRIEKRLAQGAGLPYEYQKAG
jgi:DeoR family transcriptional regulator, catabolite repression regulator